MRELLPRAPRPGDDLQVLGTLTNSGSQPLRSLQLRVRTGNRLATRGELRQADAVPPSYREPRTVLDLPDLAAGETAPLDLRLTVDSLRLTADGVYPLLLEARGLTGAPSARTTVGQVATYLPWFGSTAVDPLRIAWLWPLVDEPHKGPDERLVDDDLATSFGGGGRLGRSLTAAGTGLARPCPPAAAATADRTVPATSPPFTCTPVPVTYAVDPDLLDTADTMSRPYEVAAPEGAVQPGGGTTAAQAWLTGLRSGVTAGDVLALPYGDPDLVALTRASSGLTADVGAAQGYGTTLTRELLDREPLQSVAFPPDGRLSDAAYDSLTGTLSGTGGAVVLGADVVTPGDPDARSTPGARVELPPSSTAGAVTGLVVDRGLSDLLVPARPQDARLAEQRFLVETALIAAELPSRGRTLVVVPPRRGELDPAVAGAAVADTGAVPWMCPVLLRAVAAQQEACPGAAVPSYAPERAADLAQADARDPALSPELLSQVAAVRTAATQLTGAVIKGGTDQAQATRSRLQRAWLRGESSAWRDDRAGGLRLVRQAAAAVTALRDQVSVLTGRVTLTSNNGRVSVAVLNELDQPVTVALELRAPADARLSQTRTDVLEVAARTSLPVQVNAQTLTSGRFVVKAQLLDRDGMPFGEPKDLLVRSTRYATVALAVTGLGAAVLLVAAGVRVGRRALRARNLTA